MNVLIVDDEENCVKALQTEIEWHKYEINHVFGAMNSTEAKKIFSQINIDLLLCDIEMPGESGLELIEWVREGTRLDEFHTECVVLTCYPDYKYMRKAIQLGCSDYLIKPLDYLELHKVIEKAIGKIEANKLEAKKLENMPEFPADFDKHDIIHNKVIPYIQAHITEPFTISDLAKHVSLNPQYMMRLFKKTMGKSIIEYVTGYKMELAKELLRTSQWTNEIIAEKVGYVGANYFIRLFKKQLGMTPREYRKQIMK